MSFQNTKKSALFLAPLAHVPLAFATVENTHIQTFFARSAFQRFTMSHFFLRFRSVRVATLQPSQ